MATIIPTAMTTDQSLLHLMRLVSPALPVGAYVYSQGLESAVEKSWVNDIASAEHWLSGTLSNAVARLDAPVFLRLCLSWQQDNIAAVNHWNQFLQAARETSELLLEDTQMGTALSRLLIDLGIEQASDVSLEQPLSFATAFALAAHYWNISDALALQGLLWSWLENQVAAAIKLIPLGQTQGQHLLVKLTPAIQNAISVAQSLEDDNLGWSLPRLTMASIHHETQYSRLFRS